MRAPTRAHARRRAVLRCGVALAAALAATGCATLRATVAAHAPGAGGVARDQQRLRDALARGDFAAALGRRADDALLAQLDAGIVSFYAAQYERSAATLDTAALLADDRIPASLSRDALALLTNDAARPYQPRRTERLFIPYYAMLAYVRLERWEDAAVEARPLVALLAQYAEDGDDEERALHASLHELAGAVFDRAGEAGEARVAYRAARATRHPGDSAAASFAGAAARGATGRGKGRGRGGDEGELLLVVERGFVAHLVTETMTVELGADDGDSLRRTDDRVVAGPSEGGTGDGRTGLLRAVAAATSSPAVSIAGRGARRRPSGSAAHEGDGDDYLLTLALPALRRSAGGDAAPLGVTVDGDTLAVSGTMSGAVSGTRTVTGSVALVDDARQADARRERTAIVTRAVARAAAKYAMTRAARDRGGETGGTIANLAGMLLERADLRSWHLLPREITLVRLRLPAGAHLVRLRTGGPAGSGGPAVEIGTIPVRAGTVTIVPTRLWEGATAPRAARPDSLQPPPADAAVDPRPAPR